MRIDKRVSANLSGVEKADGWIGVDLDGTLAEYHGWNAGKIGAPIPAMVERVKAWLSKGREVRIFTGRVADGYDVAPIRAWCKDNLGQELEVTSCKDKGMIELWDDKARQVKTNTGELVGGSDGDEN